jgi:transposase
MLTRDQFQTLHDQGPDAVYALLVAMQAQMEAQQQQIAVLTARVQQLEGRLSKDSHNSSKPPSSDPPARKPVSLRKKTGKSSGGQKGHPGTTLSFSETPDQILWHRPSLCTACGGTLSEAAEVGSEKRQVWDLPPLRLLVTEHRAVCCVCPTCHTTNPGVFPPSVSQPVQYGPGVLSLGVYLMHYQLLPYARTRQLFFDLLGHAPAEGTLATALATCHGALLEIETAIKDAVARAEVAHLDETSLRVQKRLHWLHVSSTKTLTFYAPHTKRGREALNEIGLLPRLGGVRVHDAWPAYLSYGGRFALCNAHLLRELIGLFEQTKQTWTQRLRALLLTLKHAKEKAQTCGERGFSLAYLARVVGVYDQIVERGLRQNPAPPLTGKQGRPKKSEARNLLERLDKHKAAVLGFAFDFVVPFDNNLAERDLRMVKVRQKVSGCFRSDDGLKQFCRIRGYLSTMRKQGQEILAALQSVFLGNPTFPQRYA